MPIVGTSVVGATGVKPIKFIVELYADFNVNDETYSCIFIIIQKLNKNCILGIDVLKKFKGRINIEENYMILRIEDKELKIEFINDEEKCIWLIHEINMEPNEDLTNIDPQDFANEINYPEKYEEFSNVKEYDEIEEKYCITDVEIEEKVAKCELLIWETKEKILGNPEKVQTYPRRNSDVSPLLCVISKNEVLRILLSRLIR